MQAVYPYAGMGSYESQRNVQYICLELLLSFVNDMTVRALEVCTFLLCFDINFNQLYSLLNLCPVGQRFVIFIFIRVYLWLHIGVSEYSNTSSIKVKKAACSHWGGSFQHEAQGWACIPGGEWFDIQRYPWRKNPSLELSYILKVM